MGNFASSVERKYLTCIEDNILQHESSYFRIL
jgi:hypothetical protein